MVVNAALNRLAVRSAAFARLFDGAETTVVEHGRIDWAALRKLGMRRAELDNAVREQNGNHLDEVESGALEPSGHLLINPAVVRQGATKADVDLLSAQLARIESALAGR